MVISRDSIFAEFNEGFTDLDDFLLDDEDLIFLKAKKTETSDIYVEDIDELDAPIGNVYDENER